MEKAADGRHTYATDVNAKQSMQEAAETSTPMTPHVDVYLRPPTTKPRTTYQTTKTNANTRRARGDGRPTTSNR